MFKFCNLYSGSSGNCSLVETENTKILVDAGVTSKKIQEGLNQCNVDIKDIDAIIITHEHADHVKGLQVLCKNNNIPVYANSHTFSMMKPFIPENQKRKFNTNEFFEINDLRIFPFSIPHDAADPCGFSIFHDKNKISVATDIGHMENRIIDILAGSKYVLLESNYEPDMLKCSKYPYMLKRRILGENGHLSNEDAAKTISILAKQGVKNFSLGHLSEQNNLPELAYQTTMNPIIETNSFDDKLRINVCDRYKPNDAINIEVANC